MSFRMFACAVCGKVVQGKRAHALTCSPACRVRLYRHPDIRARLLAESRSARLILPWLLELHALARVYPDLAELVRQHKIGIHTARRKARSRWLLHLFERAIATRQAARTVGRN